MANEVSKVSSVSVPQQRNFIDIKKTKLGNVKIEESIFKMPLKDKNGEIYGLELKNGTKIVKKDSSDKVNDKSKLFLASYKHGEVYVTSINAENTAFTVDSRNKNKDYISMTHENSKIHFIKDKEDIVENITKDNSVISTQ